MASRSIVEVGVEVCLLQPIALAIAGHPRIAFLEDSSHRIQIEVLPREMGRHQTHGSMLTITADGYAI